MRIVLEPATPEEAAAVADLRNAVAEDLTIRHGKGPWSGCVTSRGVLYDMKRARVFVARSKNHLVATLTLGTRKPWAIDKTYFSDSKNPLYLTSMAVVPGMQRCGIGRRCLDEVMQITAEWPGDAVRLDAFDAEAGAGEFYRKCGFNEVGRASYRDTPLIYFEMVVAPAQPKGEQT